MDPLELLRVALDDPRAEFRLGQAAAIRGLIEQGGRHLVVQRTGWGKSMVFFIATRMLRGAGAGPTLVISPLLALMRDQVRAAERLGLRAERVDSSNRDDWPAVIEALESDAVDLIYVSPERLGNSEFLRDVLPRFGGRIELLVVDEAHCISDWGHDFRPDYRRIRDILARMSPEMRLLAVTATANDRVVADLVEQLGPRLTVSRGNLMRKSLALQATVMPSIVERYAWLAQHVPTLPGSGIIYALTTRDARRVAAWLQREGISAEAYWGGRAGDERLALEAALHANEVKALVATTALGMGFDKPDLGFVVHLQRPQSIVHYYQQVGRAGRAIPEAVGILMSGSEDEEILEWFVQAAFPTQGDVDRLLEHLRCAGEKGHSTVSLQSAANMRFGRLERALRFLASESPAPLRRERGRWYANPVGPYVLPADRIAAIGARRRAELEEMGRYLATDTCLMMFIQRALDDEAERIRPCGRCGNCLGRDVIAHEIDPVVVARARDYLGHQYVPLGPRKRWPAGLDEIKSRGWRATLGRLALEPGFALCHFSDPVRGDAVRAWKLHGAMLPAALLDDLAELLHAHWRPDPAPMWIACVPSLRSPERAPALATGVADRLGVPFLPAAVRKVRETEPQKTMENSWHQVRNIIDAFEVELPSARREQPVLLVDDVVDARWTFTVIGALLREAGAGPVYPLALASISNAPD